MRRPPNSRWLLMVGVAAGVVALDQISKWWALASVSGPTVDVVWTLQLHVAHNTGAAFSLFNKGGGQWIALIALGVVGFLVWQGRTTKNRFGAVALGLVLGGAIGNLSDRLFRGTGFLNGAVVDFIDFQWWPVFNVADMGVVVGSILLVVVMLFSADGAAVAGD